MEIDVSEQDVNVPPSHEKSYTEKLQETAGEAKDTVVTGMQIVQETVVEAKDVLASKVGLHGSKEEGDAGKSSIVSGQEEQSATAATPRFHPGDEDRALSQLITEKLTLGATTLKDKLMRPFGIKSKPSTPTSTAQQPPPALSHALSKEKPVTESEGEKEQHQGLVGKARGAVSSMLAPVTSPSTPSTTEQPPPALSHALSEEKPVAESEGEKEQHQGLAGKAREAVSSMLSPVTSHLSSSSHEEKKQVLTEEGGDKGQQGVIGKVSETISSMLTPHHGNKGEESLSSTSSHEEKQVTEEGGDKGQQGVIGKVSESISSMLTPHGNKGEESHSVESGGENEQQGLVDRASEIIHSMIGETPRTAGEEKQEVESSQTPRDETQVEFGGEKEQVGMLGKASEMVHSMLRETPKTGKESGSATSKPDESGVCSVEMH
jgi:hypothetical protein